MEEMLVIGYGNVLRGDDGVGPAIAARVAQASWAGKVETLICQQLLPEMAETITHVACVVFVDAAAHGRPAEIRCHAIAPDAADDPLATHRLTPQGVLALAQLLYGRVPAAWLLTVAGHDFSHSESMTPAVETAVAAAVDRIRELALAETVTDAALQ